MCSFNPSISRPEKESPDPNSEACPSQTARCGFLVLCRIQHFDGRRTIKYTKYFVVFGINTEAKQAYYLKEEEEEEEEKFSFGGKGTANTFAREP